MVTRPAPPKRQLTKSPRESRCRWCGRDIPPRPGPGRRREFCTDSCRQLDYQNRRRAATSGLRDDEVIVSRKDIEDLHDRLYALEAAVEDVERDLLGGAGLREHRDAVAWLLEAARPLVAKRLFAEESET